MDGAVAIGPSFFRGDLAHRMDGLAVGGSDRGVVCGIDSGVDDGALCPGPSDHPGYDADLLDYGGVGLSGAKGDGNRQPKGGFPFLFVHGYADAGGVFGKRIRPGVAHDFGAVGGHRVSKRDAVQLRGIGFVHD